MHANTLSAFLPPDTWARVTSEEVLHREKCGCIHTRVTGVDREGRLVSRPRWILCDRCGWLNWLNGYLTWSE